MGRTWEEQYTSMVNKNKVEHKGMVRIRAEHGQAAACLAFVPGGAQIECSSVCLYLSKNVHSKCICIWSKTLIKFKKGSKGYFGVTV